MQDIVVKRPAGIENRISAPKSTGGVIVVVPGEASLADIDSVALSLVGQDVVALEGDGYSIRGIRGQIFLAGRNPRAVLYATYHLLELLGVRFFAPSFDFYGGHSEFVPRIENLTLPEVNVQTEPDFERRSKYVGAGLTYTPSRICAVAEWMAKVRLNTFAFPYNLGGYGRVAWDKWREKVLPCLQRRGISIEVGGHGYQSFLPPDQYKADHPTWFVDGATVFNVANRRALSTYVRNVVEYLRKRPEISIFDAWPPDYATWPEQVIDRFGSESNAQSYLIEKLRRSAERHVPRVQVEAIAYERRKVPPHPSYAFHPRVVIDLAVQGRSYAAPISNTPGRNAEYESLVREWKATFEGTFGIFEYYRKMSWHSLPVVLPHVIAADMTAYRDLGVEALGIYAEPGDWLTYEPVHLLVARASWDSDVTADAFMNEYLTARYGSSSDILGRYFDAVESAGRLLFDRMRGNYRDLEVVTGALNDYRLAAQALDTALAGKANQAVRYLLRRLRWNTSFAICDTRISQQSLLNNPVGASQAGRRVKRLVKRHAMDGILVANRWLRGRYTQQGSAPRAPSVFN